MAPTAALPNLTTSAVKRKVEQEVTSKRSEEEPPKKRPPLLSLDAMSRPRLEDNPLRKKRKLFETNDEPVIVKKKVSSMQITKAHLQASRFSQTRFLCQCYQTV